MSADDTTDDDQGTDQTDGDEIGGDDGDSTDVDSTVDGDEFDAEGSDVRDRLEEEADRAVEQFDEGIVDMLSWVLETETRARIYVFLRQNPDSTSDEIASGTGLYPSTVREALAELHDEGKVTRHKRESDGAGNNPYEYAAMAPSELVGNIVDDVQAELNTVFNLDQVLGAADGEEPVTDEEPVTITVEDADVGASTDDDATTIDVEGTGGDVAAGSDGADADESGRSDGDADAATGDGGVDGGDGASDGGDDASVTGDDTDDGTS